MLFAAVLGVPCLPLACGGNDSAGAGASGADASQQATADAASLDAASAVTDGSAETSTSPTDGGATNDGAVADAPSEASVVCTPPQAACGTQCVDLATSQNCGRCGHDCQGGNCTNSTCMPVKLASGTGDAVAIAVDSAYVYWASNTAVDGGTVGSVTRVPTGGGAPEPLATVPMSIGDIAVDATSVYFTAADDSVRKTPLAGGGGTTVSTGPAPATGTGPGPLAIDATNIYWLVYATGGPPALGAIFSAPLGGGPPATVLSPLLASSMAIDASHVYWLAEGTGGGGSISSTPKGGGASTVVVGDPKTPSRFRVYGSSLYWTSGFDANGAVSTAGVASVRGSPTPLVSGQVDPSAIAVDASGLYFATGKVNGLGLASPTLRRAPLAGGNATPIAADPLAFDIALGPAAVYWIGWDGSVWKVAKP